MRISLQLILVTAVFFMLFSTGCPSGETPPPSDTTPSENTPAAGDDNAVDEPVELVDVDLTGTSPELMLEKWLDLGEETEDVKFWVEDFEGEFYVLEKWIITELTIDEYYEVEYELPAGTWESHAWGGNGTVDLDMYVYGEGGDEDILDDDELADNFPMLSFDLDEPATVTFYINPFELDEDAATVNILWYLFESK